MIRRPPRSTQSRSSAASDVYKRQASLARTACRRRERPCSSGWRPTKTRGDSMPERAAPDPLYVASRRVLLDALEALSAQRRAAILVGAHAVYLRVGKGDLATTPHTTDADLALDPSLLGGDPVSYTHLR